MKKFIFALATITIMFSCATAGPAVEEVDEPSVKIEFLEHTYSAFDGSAPAWVPATVREIENTPDYEGYYIVKAESSGQDKDGALLAAGNINAAADMARAISLRVQEKFAGAQIGDKDLLETYMEQVVKSLADATLSGFRKEGDFWAHVKITDESGSKTEYRVWTMYSIPQTIVDKLVQDSFNGVDSRSGAANEEEATARVRVREAMNGGL